MTNKLRLLLEARKVNDYENMSRQQQENILTNLFAPTPTPAPKPP